MKPTTRIAATAAAGLAALLLLGATTAGNRAGSEVAVSGADYDAAIQERAGYAITLRHYVDRHHALKGELGWWRTVVADLADGAAPGIATAAHDAEQERLGYQVATGHLVGVKRGLGQTLTGYQAVLASQIDQNDALRQRQLGLEYMLKHQMTRRAG